MHRLTTITSESEFTERRLKRAFVDAVNDHIQFYNIADRSFGDYHQGAVGAHLTTARIMGWHDVADRIEEQCSAIFNGKKPETIKVGGL